MPHAQPHKATWALRVSVSVPPSLAHNSLTRLSSIRHAGVLLRRSSTTRKDSAAGTYGVCECQERVVPHAQPHQATWALRVSVSVPPSLAHNGLARLNSMCLEGVRSNTT